MEEYLNFLRSFLTDLDLTVDNNDYVRYNDESRTPILVEGRRLVLPSEAHRRNPTDDKYILHPLNENTVADLSPVLKELMRLASTNLNILFATYAVEIIRVASDKGRQVSLTDHQLDLIAKLKSCKASDEKDVTRIAMDVLLKIAQENPLTSFVQLGLTRGRVYRGEKRHRAGTVQFPMYEQLLKDDDVPRQQAKIDVSKDVRHTLVEVHEAIFPAVAEDEAYGFTDVTNRTIAPFFITLALTYAQLANEFKQCQKTLTGLVSFTGQDEAPRLDWVGDLNNHDLLRKWAAAIPDQNAYRVPTLKDGGAEYTTEAAPAQQTQVAQAVQQVAQPAPVATPAPATQPAPAAAGPRTIDPDDFVRTYSSGSTFAATQQIKTQLKAYIDGYKAYWDDHLARYRTAPPNYPHPTVVPAGQLPPNYPGAPALPMGFFPGGSANAMAMPQIGTGMPMMGMGGVPMMGMPGFTPGTMPGYPQAGYPNQAMMMGGMYPQVQNGYPTMMGGMGAGAMVYGNGVAMNPLATGGVANASAHPLFRNTAAGSGSVSPGTI